MATESGVPADMSIDPCPAGPPGADRAGRAGRSTQQSLLLWRVLSALALLAMGGIHVYLTFEGTGGLLGRLFVLNGLGALVLAVAMLVVRGPLLRDSSAIRRNGQPRVRKR